MSSVSVAVIATPGVSPFHFSIPCMIFGQAVQEPDMFTVNSCAEQPGSVLSDMGFYITVEHGLELLETANIIIPCWSHPEEEPSPEFLDRLQRAWRRGCLTMLGSVRAGICRFAG